MRSIAHSENAGDRRSAGVARYNVAQTLRATGRTSEAAGYAAAALRDFAISGDDAHARTPKG
jgi:hypothetical protein